MVVKHDRRHTQFDAIALLRIGLEADSQGQGSIPGGVSEDVAAFDAKLDPGGDVGVGERGVAGDGAEACGLAFE